MKEQFVKWLPVLALACFAAAVFLNADGYYRPGIAGDADSFCETLKSENPERKQIR